MVTKKSAVLAGVLPLLFGPLGYLYLNWRFALSVFAVFLLYLPLAVLCIVIFNPLPGQWLLAYLPLAVYGWTGATYAKRWNVLVEHFPADAEALFKSAEAAFVVAGQVLVALCSWFALLLHILLAFKLDSLLLTLAMLFVFAPLAAKVVSFLLGFPLALLFNRFISEEVSEVFS